MFLSLIGLILIGVMIFFVWSLPKNGEDKAEHSEDSLEELRDFSPEAKKFSALPPGTILKINNAGESLEDLDLKVLSKNLYTQGSFEWIEYELTSAHQKYWLTVEEDDELELTLTFRKINLREINLSKTQLEQIDREERGELVYQDKRFYYQDSGGAVFFKNSKESLREEFYYWEFEDQEEDYFISVENWSGSLEASLGKYLDQRHIEIYG